MVDQEQLRKQNSLLIELKKQKSWQKKIQGSKETEDGTTLTLVFFSGLGGSSLLGGAVMSFPVTASAGLVSSGFPGGKETSKEGNG